jgi:MEMO1 family protein
MAQPYLIGDFIVMPTSHAADAHRRELEGYLKSPVRPTSHAGASYPDDPDEMQRFLAAIMKHAKATRTRSKPLRAVLSPHIDPLRGGPAYAPAYRAIVDHSHAELFIIFGTAHDPMRQRLAVTRKDFATPLGTVSTDQRFIDRLAAELSSSVAGRRLDLFRDELAHRHEHSIEFQAVFLQYVLGSRRAVKIVPILAGSVQDLVADYRLPAAEPELQAFIAAMRAAVAAYPGKVCYISGADLAHIGPRFGDRWLLTERRLDAQADDDHKLLESVCNGDAAGLFRHVARNSDRYRICGLAPTYLMLEILGPVRGELMRYDQTVEPDRTACVSFASAAFW